MMEYLRSFTLTSSTVFDSHNLCTAFNLSKAFSRNSVNTDCSILSRKDMADTVRFVAKLIVGGPALLVGTVIFTAYVRMNFTGPPTAVKEINY